MDAAQRRQFSQAAAGGANQAAADLPQQQQQQLGAPQMVTGFAPGMQAQVGANPWAQQQATQGAADGWAQQAAWTAQGDIAQQGDAQQGGGIDQRPPDSPVRISPPATPEPTAGFGQVFIGLEGTYEDDGEPRFGIPGSLPLGSGTLTLIKAMEVDGEAVQSIRVNMRGMGNGPANMTGRLEKKKTFSEADPEGGGYEYYILTGATAAPQPYYDGEKFFSSDGENRPLPTAVLPYPPMMADAPGKTAVLDPREGKVYVASMGGFIMAGTNPFHGLSEPHPFRYATAQEQADYQTWDDAGFLESVYKEGNAGVVADGMDTIWTTGKPETPAAGRIFKAQYGGIAGFHGLQMVSAKLT